MTEVFIISMFILSENHVNQFIYFIHFIGLEFRLANGTTPKSGRIEIGIDGTWGTICGHAFLGNEAADVICKQMNYKGGRTLEMGYFGPGEGKIYMTKVKCKGDEPSIMQCPIIFEPDGFQQGSGKAPRYRENWRHTASYHYRYSSCWSHNDDAAIQCYTSGLKKNIDVTKKAQMNLLQHRHTSPEHFADYFSSCTAHI